MAQIAQLVEQTRRWGSVNRAKIIHNRQNEQSWVIRRRGTIAPRHFDCFEIERGGDVREATGTVFEKVGQREQGSEGEKERSVVL